MLNCSCNLYIKVNIIVIFKWLFMLFHVRVQPRSCIHKLCICFMYYYILCIVFYVSTNQAGTALDLENGACFF